MWRLALILPAFVYTLVRTHGYFPESYDDAFYLQQALQYHDILLEKGMADGLYSLFFERGFRPNSMAQLLTVFVLLTGGSVQMTIFLFIFLFNSIIAWFLFAWLRKQSDKWMAGVLVFAFFSATISHWFTGVVISELPAVALLIGCFYFTHVGRLWPAALFLALAITIRPVEVIVTTVAWTLAQRLIQGRWLWQFNGKLLLIGMAAFGLWFGLFFRQFWQWTALGWFFAAFKPGNISMLSNQSLPSYFNFTWWLAIFMMLVWLIASFVTRKNKLLSNMAKSGAFLIALGLFSLPVLAPILFPTSMPEDNYFRLASLPVTAGMLIVFSLFLKTAPSPTEKPHGRHRYAVIIITVLTTISFIELQQPHIANASSFTKKINCRSDIHKCNPFLYQCDEVLAMVHRHSADTKSAEKPRKFIPLFLGHFHNFTSLGCNLYARHKGFAFTIEDISTKAIHQMLQYLNDGRARRHPKKARFVYEGVLFADIMQSLEVQSDYLLTDERAFCQLTINNYCHGKINVDALPENKAYQIIDSKQGIMLLQRRQK